ncbi:hypothetical protein [Acidicapsa ligni]|uniref:hypothetical protein n=1 Tax=Acidicapsa ligni TaxID=542300 RepID=UPI0021DFFC54|nr:hypothetical protein [Acidicapsa ligni]
MSMINGLDIMLLLKLSRQKELRVPSVKLAAELFLPPSEVSESLTRCTVAGLLYKSDIEKRVNRAGLLEFLAHGFRYVFPAERGSLTRGIPTGIAAEPLKSHFLDSGEPPPVWPYAEGTVRGIALIPLHKQVPKAALQDPELYEMLALLDAIRGDRVRERKLAVEKLTSRLNPLLTKK